MACCGGGRTSPSRPSSPVHVSRLAHSDSPVSFVYLGKATLNVIGNATGRLYRFDGPGSVLPVDARDAPGLVAVPMVARHVK